MSDTTKKSAIPAWQLAGKTVEQPPNADQPTLTATPDTATESTTVTTNSSDETDQRQQIAAFLENDAVKDEPIEKKRAFLMSKDMPVHLIDEALEQTQSINATELEVAEFQSQMAQKNKLSIAQQTPNTLQEPQQAAAPIITYPEFLANAHQSAPLVTPSRVLATTYVASATAVLAYAASTFLVKPMTAALTDARHDLATHSNNRVSELNERLEKLVSRVPGAKHAKDEDVDNAGSEQTELTSKDESTQTEVADSSKVTILEPTATVKQVEKLGELRKHLDSIVAGAQKEATAGEEREDGVKKLRQYLDGLAYGGAGLWNSTGGQFSWEQQQQQDKQKKDDAIEDLKKEIRGVKGVLLSAKRFPAAGRGTTGMAGFPGRRVETAA